MMGPITADMTRIAIWEVSAPDADAPASEWGEHVADEEYQATSARPKTLRRGWADRWRRQPLARGGVATVCSGFPPTRTEVAAG